jgi:hypothetical protein
VFLLSNPGVGLTRLVERLLVAPVPRSGARLRIRVRVYEGDCTAKQRSGQSDNVFVANEDDFDAAKHVCKPTESNAGNRIVLNKHFRSELRHTIASLGQSALGDVGFVPLEQILARLHRLLLLFQTSRSDPIDHHRHSR